MRTCVVIPTYNEAKAIASVVRQVRGQNLEAVVIDDGSQDNTAQIARDNQATVLRNERNQGKGASLKIGFEYALNSGFDAVITMDGDGQHDPLDIPYFIRLALNPDSSILVGNRLSKAKNMPWLRLITNRFMSWLISGASGQHISDTQCGFRLIKKEVLEKVKLVTSKYETESEILIRSARMGFKIESVPVKTIYNGEKSQINPFTDTLRFIKFILGQLWTTRT